MEACPVYSDCPTCSEEWPSLLFLRITHCQINFPAASALFTILTPAGLHTSDSFLQGRHPAGEETSDARERSRSRSNVMTRVLGHSSADRSSATSAGVLVVPDDGRTPVIGDSLLQLSASLDLFQQILPLSTASFSDRR